MKPNLMWLYLILQIFVLLSGFVNVVCSISDFDIFNVQQFEECVVTLLSSYPFVSKENMLQMNKILNRHTFLLNKNPERQAEGKEIGMFGRDLVNLVIINDLLKSTREIAYVSAIERCSLLVTGDADSELKKAALIFFHFSDNKDLHSIRKEALGPQILEKEKSAMPIYNSETKFGLRNKRELSPFESPPTTINNQEETPIDEPTESTIFNILRNSPIFIDTFHIGMPQQIAKSYSSAIVEAGLSGFEPEIVNGAIKAVVSDMPLTTSNTENYASIISRAIVSILRLHNGVMFADGTLIANNILRKLETLTSKQNVNLEFSETAEQPNPIFETGREIVLSEVKLKPPNINPLLGVPMINPSPVPSPQIENFSQEFKDELANLLSGSEIMSNLFCNGALSDILRTIKMGLSDFGLMLSLNSAIAVTNAMEELGSELACLRFADVVAEIIRNSLLDNEMLETVDAAEVLKKLISNVNNPFEMSSSIPSRPIPQVFNTDVSSISRLLPSFSDISIPEHQEPMIFEQYPDTEDLYRGTASSNSSDSVIQTENSNPASITHYDFSEIKDVLPLQAPPISTDVASMRHINPTRSNFSKTDSKSANQSITIYEQVSNSTNKTTNVSFRSLQLEPGPWLPNNATLSIENSSDTVDNSSYMSRSEPLTTISTDVMTEITGSDGFLTIFMGGTDFTTNTPDPFIKNLTDAIDNPRKLAEFFMENINTSLKALSSSESSFSKDSNLETDYSSIAEVSSKEENLSPNSTKRIDRTVNSTLSMDDTSIDPINSSEILEISAVNSTKSAESYLTNQNTSSSIELSETASTDGSPNIQKITSFDPDLVQNITQRNETKNSENAFSAKKISSISASSISFIRSSNFSVLELCDRLNELAETVHIAPIPADNCYELALVDYLLHILNAFTSEIAKST